MRKCGFCKRPYPVSDRVAEESPFCQACLHQRIAQRLAERDRVEYNPKDTFLAVQDTFPGVVLLGLGLIQLITPEDHLDPWFGLVGVSLAIFSVICMRAYRRMSREELRIPSREWIKPIDLGPGAAPFGFFIGTFIRAYTSNNWQPVPTRLVITLSLMFLVVFFARRDRLAKGIIFRT